MFARPFSAAGLCQCVGRPNDGGRGLGVLASDGRSQIALLVNAHVCRARLTQTTLIVIPGRRPRTIMCLATGLSRDSRVFLPLPGIVRLLLLSG